MTYATHEKTNKQSTSTTGGLKNPVGEVLVDLDAVVDNYKNIQDKTGPSCKVSAVVKADGFGLGAVPIAKALHQAGCNDFFVATPYEGEALRQHIPDAHIYILNGYFSDEENLYTNASLTPVLNSLIEIEAYSHHAQALKKRLPAFLNFNIRMNRLGLAAAEQDRILNEPHLLENIDVTGTMSHFACADEPDSHMNDVQCENFKKVSAHFPDAIKTLSNSSGIFRQDAYHFDLVRPGAALYGINPTPGQQNIMKAVLSVKLPVLRTRLVYEGATVGYNSTYKFEKDTWIATLSCGYADGLLRSLSNTGKIYINGKPCPIRGRISMDLTTIDLSALSEDEKPKPGDYVELLGPHQTIDDLAHDAGTIGYEIITSLGPRYKYRYKQNGIIHDKDAFHS